MKTTKAIYGWRLLVFAALALLASVGNAAAADSVLYELMENTTYGPGYGAISRIATAALQGTAKLGTPWCPSAKILTNVRAETCTITAIGKDDVDVVPYFDANGYPSFSGGTPNHNFGSGTVEANWATVVNMPADNLVDSPEDVVATGTFRGTIDLSRAAAGLAPLGFLDGAITVNGVNDANGNPVEFKLKGTFRLPFAIERAKGEHRRPQRGRAAYYLGNDGVPVSVGPHERSLGWPTVRLDINFE